MSLLRLLLLAVAAASLTACSVSTVNDTNADQLHLTQAAGTDAQAPAVAPPKEPPAQTAASGEQEAALKTAISLASVSDPSSKAYKIGPLDVLDITVFKVPDLSKTVQVSEAGTINLPLVGEVQAGGRSARELEQDLTKRLGAKYLQNPQITIFVKEYNSQRVTIAGAVKKPGVLPMVGGLTLLQAIAQSGGREDVAESEVLVMRVSDGKRLAGRYNVLDIQEGNASDPQLQSGDVIVVPTSDMKQGVNAVLKVLPLAGLAPLL